ncbi:uncharacterized protein G2W53_033732 [Senna tora]|uniref:Uncharacterized protein n=1 Tax=Senna tora TaxID=362788 RepID=A0A834SZY9_9FABA|nr:uncharacterized protein G2W53_033732 [Senna tora]
MPDTLAIVPSAILMCRGVLQALGLSFQFAGQSGISSPLPDWATCVADDTIGSSVTSGSHVFEHQPGSLCCTHEVVILPLAADEHVHGLPPLELVSLAAVLPLVTEEPVVSSAAMFLNTSLGVWNGAEAEQKGKNSFVVTLRILFSVLGVFMLLTLAYTIITDGSPFRMDLLTPCIQPHEPSQALEKQLPEPKDKFVCLYIMNDFNSSLHHLTLVPIELMSELNGTEVVGLLWLFIANSIPSRQARTCHDLGKIQIRMVIKHLKMLVSSVIFMFASS